MKRSIILCAIVAIAYGGKAQSDSTTNVINLSVGYHNGFILPHSDKIRNVSNTKPWGLEANIAWHLMEKNAWNYCFCFPRTGFSLLYVDYNNPEVIGSSISMYPYIEPYLGAENKLNASFRFGFGPAYVTKTYDPETNPENQFISTHLSFVVVLRGAVNYRINELTGVSLTAGLNHISNGGIKNPNLGINFPTVSLNVERYLNVPEFKDWQKQEGLRIDPDKHKFFLEYYATGKAIRKGDERYLATGFVVSYGRVIGRINGLRFGLEGLYDGAAREVINRNELPNHFDESPDHLSLGLLIGNDFLLGRFIFYQHFGIYLYERYIYMDPVYQRYGISYFLTKNKKFLVGINLKAHRHDADFLDVRIGYKF